MNYLLLGRQKKNRRKRLLNREEYAYARWSVLITAKLILMENAREVAKTHGVCAKKRRRRKIEGICIKRAHELAAKSKR